MKILKIFLILSSLFLFLNADDYKSKHKYKHSYKNLEYLDLNKEQIKEIKDVLIEFKYKYKEFYEYEKKQEDILKDITKNDNFDEKLYLDTLLDLKTKASKLQVQKMKEIHKILDKKQKQRAIAEATGRQLPEEVKKPEYSYTANALIEAYNVISRSRRYEQGIPLALSIADLNAYCEQYELPVERYIFNAVIFDLDNRFIDEAYKRMQKKSA